MHVEGAGQAGDGPSDGEHPDLEGHGVVAERLHAALVVADADQHRSDGPTHQQTHACDDEDGHDRDEQVLGAVGPLRPKCGDAWDVGQAVESAGHVAPLLRDLLEGERQHQGQQPDDDRGGPSPERGDGHAGRDGRTDQRRHQQRGQGQRRCGGGDAGGGVGRDPEGQQLAQREDPRVAPDQVEAHRQHGEAQEQRQLPGPEVPQGDAGRRGGRRRSRAVAERPLHATAPAGVGRRN